MERSAYKSPVPLHDTDLYDEAKMHEAKLLGFEAEIDGLKTETKDKAEQRDRHEQQMRLALRCAREGRPAYRLKDGSLTDEAPDKQQDLPIKA